MRTILTLIRKEFLQVFRNKTSIPIIFVVPMIQLIVIVNAATMEMKNIQMAVVDQDLSTTSRKLVSKFEASPFFKIPYRPQDIESATRLMDDGKVDVVLHISNQFEQELTRENQAKVQVAINAINGTTASISSAYIGNMIMAFNKDIQLEFMGITIAASTPTQIVATPAFWYNTELNYSSYMIPAILVILVTMIGMFLSGLNLVREKEMGTIEQINVTPIRKHEFILGKLVPFWILALIELAVGLAFGKLIYDIPIVGSVPLLFFVAGIYLIVVLGIGLLISTISQTQQQTMFIMYFFVMVFIMMSGIFTPVETMPEWAQKLNLINPVYYFMKIVRMILLKGSDLTDFWLDMVALALLGLGIMTMAIRKYRKVA